VQAVLYRSPQLYDLQRSRWTLSAVRAVVQWMKDLSIPGVYKLLKRLRVSYKRGQEHVHSPDLEYDKKLALIRQAQRQCQQDPQRFVFLYEDEHTYYRRPPTGSGYAGTNGSALRAEQGHGYDTTRRIAACLDVATGAVIERQRGSFNVKEMARYLRYVEKHYPHAETIYIALDNWPVHFHPYVLEELERHHSRIQLLRLPTYAPWTNPTEKVWRKLNQDILCLHRRGDQWESLKDSIAKWFEPLHRGSEDLLHYVGLRPKLPPPRKRCPD